MVRKNLASSGNRSLKNLVFQCILRTIVAGIIAFFLYSFITIIAVGTGTSEIGYTVLYSEDGENFEEVYTHYYEDGDDTRIDTYAEDEHYYKTAVRSELSSTRKNMIMWLSQGFSMIIWYLFIYSVLWQAGDANANMAELGNAKRDNLKGLKAGLFADIPFAICYLMLIITSASNVLPHYPGVYKIFTYFMHAFNDTFMPLTENGLSVTAGGVAASVIVLLPLPLFTSFSYFMGQKHIIVKEKIMYKANKGVE